MSVKIQSLRCNIYDVSTIPTKDKMVAHPMLLFCSDRLSKQTAGKPIYTPGLGGAPFFENERGVLSTNTTRWPCTTLKPIGHFRYIKIQLDSEA